MLTEEGWLRFSVVRDPAPRLWSAWQSKLLLREPRFLDGFRREALVPADPARPHGRSRGLPPLRGGSRGRGGGGRPLVRPARSRRPAPARPRRPPRVARRHAVAADGPRSPTSSGPRRRGTRTARPLRMPPGVFDAATAEGLNAPLRGRLRRVRLRAGRGRCRRQGPGGLARSRWHRSLPLVQETIDRHLRIGQLHKMARRVHTVEGWLEAGAVRRTGHSRSPVLDEPRGPGGLQRPLGVGRGDDRARVHGGRPGEERRARRSRGCCRRSCAPPTASS